MLITKENLKLIRKGRTFVFRRNGMMDSMEIIGGESEAEWRSTLSEEHKQIERKNFHHDSIYNHCLSTVIKLLKVGDDLKLKWCKDYHTNGYAKNAIDSNGEWEGLHGDCLHLIIIRKKNVYTFEIAATICPDNIARMIQT